MWTANLNVIIAGKNMWTSVSDLVNEYAFRINIGQHFLKMGIIFIILYKLKKKWTHFSIFTMALT